jgi:uncharacterized protein (TIGR00369 family)
MTSFEPLDPHFATRVRESFGRQKLITAIGASITTVQPGRVTIEVPFREDLTQQHGFLHGGIVASIADSACGYAALTLMPPDAAVLTVESKVNFVAPAKGSRLIANGRVTKPGRTLTVCTGDVFALTDSREQLVAAMQATMMTATGRDDLWA